MPACISDRFDCFLFRLVMSSVPRIMRAETVIRMPTETISSINVNPASLRGARGRVVVVVTV